MHCPTDINFNVLLKQNANQYRHSLVPYFLKRLCCADTIRLLGFRRLCTADSAEQMALMAGICDSNVITNYNRTVGGNPVFKVHRSTKELIS